MKQKIKIEVTENWPMDSTGTRYATRISVNHKAGAFYVAIQSPFSLRELSDMFNALADKAANADA